VERKLVPPPPELSKSPAKLIEEEIQSKLFGQDRAIREIARPLERYFAGLNNPDHPIAVLFFDGPTGSGKTYAAEVLAGCFDPRKTYRCPQFQVCKFQTSEPSKFPVCPVHASALHRVPLKLEEIELPNILKVDSTLMSGSLEHAVTTLLGAPPSYLGHDTPPQFTGGKAPRVVLLDEAEKAILTKTWRGSAATLANVLLTIFDKGKIKNNLNEEVDFTGSIIILTGNLGAQEILREAEGKGIGFRPGHGRSLDEMGDEEIEAVNERIYPIVKEKAEREFAPEFLNRIDRLVVFRFFTSKIYRLILERELEKRAERIRNAAITGTTVPNFALTYTEEVKQLLVEEGFGDLRYGARPLSRTLEKRIVTPLSELINNGLVPTNAVLEARVETTKTQGEGDKTIVFVVVKEVNLEPTPKALPDGKGPSGT